MGEDGYTCEDNNECQDGTAFCQGDNVTCVNKPGSFECDCVEGTTLYIILMIIPVSKFLGLKALTLMNAEVLSFAHLIPFAIILLPGVTPVNVNQVLKDMVGLDQNKHQRVIKVPDVWTSTNAWKKPTTVMMTLQHVRILLVVSSVSVVPVTVVMDLSSLKVTKLSTKAVGILTNVL